MDGRYEIIQWFYRIAWVIVFVVPIYCAGYSAHTIARQARYGVYDMLILTNLTHQMVITGLSLRMLYYLRRMHILLMSTFPLLFIGTFYEVIQAHARIAVHQQPYSAINPPPLSTLMPSLLGFGLVALGLWVMPVLATFIGVEMGFWWRDSFQAIVAATLLTASIVTASLVMTIWGFLIPKSIIVLSCCLPVSFITVISIAWFQTRRFANESMLLHEAN